MPTIFISYRRSDSASEAGRIYDRLVDRYGRAQVFKDVDSIPPGVSFPDYIAESIAKSDVALIIIGPRWLNASTGFAQRRLDDPADFVRIEIETALRLGVAVIPVLLNGASLPPERRLPENLRPLLKQNGVQVRQDPDFTRDVERIFAAVDYWAAQPRRPVATPEPAPEASQAPKAAPRRAAEAHHTAAASTAVERVDIAATHRQSKRRPQIRLAPLLMLISALVVAAVSGTLVANGTAESIFNPPNITATRTASAQTATTQELQRHMNATETAAALYLVKPYAPTLGAGPCDTLDPRYTLADPSFWNWQPDTVVCATDGKTVNMTAHTSTNYHAEMDFNGFPTSPAFPPSFTTSVTIAFTHSAYSASACVDYRASAPTDTAQPVTGFTLCRDGSYLSDTETAIHRKYVTQKRSYQIFMSVTSTNASSSKITYSVNGQQVAGPFTVAGGVSSIALTLTGAEGDTIAVTDFNIQPA